MKCHRCGKFMKQLRSQMWACHCGQVLASLHGPDSTQVMQDFANMCLTNKKRKGDITEAHEGPQ